MYIYVPWLEYKGMMSASTSRLKASPDFSLSSLPGARSLFDLIPLRCSGMICEDGKPFLQERDFALFLSSVSLEEFASENVNITLQLMNLLRPKMLAALLLDYNRRKLIETKFAFSRALWQMGIALWYHERARERHHWKIHEREREKQERREGRTW